MTDRSEIERLLNQTGRTLEGLPEEYPGDRCRAVGRARGLTPAVAGNSILHQSDVIELLVGALRDALDKQPKWISVKERLPDQNGDYLIHYRFKKQSKGKGFYSVCFYERTCEKPHFHNEGYCGMYVTHWMPLPEPPEEERR